MYIYMNIYTFMFAYGLLIRNAVYKKSQNTT